ncbi:MAG: histidinol-phosphatase HisJ family protein [Clostridia bacterium]|nr:histidinol-phosphatase HisJ family protein [Clostridia bacterium]
MVADTHNHTCHFSFDAEMSIYELMTSAKEKGISNIAITEHYELGFDDQLFDIDQYSKAFVTWKDLSKDKVKLLMGVEFGYQKHLAKEVDVLAKTAPFDQIILSNHLVDGQDIYYYRDCYKRPKNELYGEYIDVMAEMADICNEYDIIGHYDYINRYSNHRNSQIFYEDCPKSFDRLFEVMIAKNKCLEINTRSIHKMKQRKIKEYMPDKAVIKRYMDMGGKMISLGSDSHTPNTLGIHFEETIDYLKELGINEVYHFENRKPVAETI